MAPHGDSWSPNKHHVFTGMSHHVFTGSHRISQYTASPQKVPLYNIWSTTTALSLTEARNTSQKYNRDILHVTMINAFRISQCCKQFSVTSLVSFLLCEILHTTSPGTKTIGNFEQRLFRLGRETCTWHKNHHDYDNYHQKGVLLLNQSPAKHTKNCFGAPRVRHFLFFFLGCRITYSLD